MEIVLTLTNLSVERWKFVTGFVVNYAFLKI